jgi:hypothetical protein
MTVTEYLQARKALFASVDDENFKKAQEYVLVARRAVGGKEGSLEHHKAVSDMALGLATLYPNGVPKAQ